MSLAVVPPPLPPSPQGMPRNLLATDAYAQEPQAAVEHPERLAALRRTGLLDTPQEEVFDRLTRLAARLLKAPATFISLVDGSRDFYKTCYGFGEPLASTRELEGRTFCHYALVADGPLLITDTLASECYSQVPTVRTLGVRAYAGIPLLSDDGYPIGSFCAIDLQPREWTEQDVEVLTELAASAWREMRMRAALTEAERQTRLAQDAARAREELLAVVAHDLRTPLNFVKIASQLIQDDPASPENRETLRRVDAAVNSMKELIDDLLRLASTRAEQALSNPRLIPADVLVQDAAAMLLPLVERHFIRLESEVEGGLPSVEVDYERILRVFSNLVLNAVKFSPAHTAIVLRAKSGEKGTVRFEVTDQGEGIPPEHIPHLFDRFWQASRQDDRGVGLGLAIAKTIVTAHGGDLAVRSTLWRGSTFWFDLPAGGAHDAAA